MDSVPSNEACLYVPTNWSLAQAHHQFSLGLSQSLTFMRSDKAKPLAEFQFTAQKQPVLDFGGACLPKEPDLDPKPDGHQGGRKSTGGISTGNTHSRKKGSHGGCHSRYAQSSSSLTSFIVQVGTLSKFLDQWRSITSNQFVLNMVKGHHLQLRCHTPLFYNFRWFDIKATPAHLPIIQKEMDKLLAKDTTEPSTHDAGFYSICCS